MNLLEHLCLLVQLDITNLAAEHARHMACQALARAERLELKAVELMNQLPQSTIRRQSTVSSHPSLDGME